MLKSENENCRAELESALSEMQKMIEQITKVDFFLKSFKNIGVGKWNAEN